MSSSPTPSDPSTVPSSSSTLASSDFSSDIRTTATTTEMSSSIASEPSPALSSTTASSVGSERGTTISSTSTPRSSTTIASSATPRVSTSSTRPFVPSTSPTQRPAPPATTASRPPVNRPDSARVTEGSSPFVSSGVSTTDVGSILTTEGLTTTDGGTPLLPTDSILPPSGDPSQSTDTTSSDQNAPTGSLSNKKGMVAGIFVAVILVVVGIIFVFWLRGRQKRKRDSEYMDAMFAGGMAERNSDLPTFGDRNRTTPTPPRRRPVPEYEGEERRPWAPDEPTGFDSLHGLYVPAEARSTSPRDPFADPPQQYKTPLVNRPLRSNSSGGSHKSNSPAPSPLPSDTQHDNDVAHPNPPPAAHNNFTVHQDPYPWLAEGASPEARRIAFHESANPRPPPAPYF